MKELQHKTLEDIAIQMMELEDELARHTWRKEYEREMWMREKDVRTI